eukprot:1784884-Prymnesium_polylepis.1
MQGLGVEGAGRGGKGGKGWPRTSALDLGEDLDALAVAQAAARDRHAGVEADVVLEQPEAGRVDALLPGIL